MKNDSVLFRERKVTQSSRRNQLDYDQSARFNTSASIININLQGSNHSQLKKVITQLEKSLNQEKEKNIQTEDRLMKHIQRANQRQQEFHAILVNANSSVYMQVSGDTNIQKLHQKVMGKMSQSQQKMREKFQSRYKQNLTIMQRKIKGIIQLMQTQLKKASTLSQSQHGQLKTNINRLQAVALQIDITNTQLMKNNAELQFRVKLLKEQKSLLIQQLNDKKNLCKKYYSRAQMYDRDRSRAMSQIGNNERSGLGSKDRIQVGRRKDVLLLGISKNTKHHDTNPKHQDNSSTNNNQVIDKQSGDFAIELVKSKMFSDEIQMGNNYTNINMVNNSPHKKVGLNKKDYISTMTIASFNPQLQAKIMTQTSRNNYNTRNHNNNNNNNNTNNNSNINSNNNNKNSPYLLTKAANSYNSTLVNSTIKGGNMSSKHQSYPLTPHNAQSNTIASLRNIITRQRQKKSQYQARLAQIQHKILVIDKIVVDSLVLVKQRQQQEQSHLMTNQIFKKTSNKNIEEDRLVMGDGKGEMVWLKSVCDKIKNIISGNGELGRVTTIDDVRIRPVTMSNSGRNVNHHQGGVQLLGTHNNHRDNQTQISPIEQSNQFTNQELLDLLKAV